MFANLGAVLAAAGAGFARRRQGDRLPHRRRRPAAVNPVRQEVFGDARPASTLVEVERARDPGREARGRGGRAAPVSDACNAVITEVEPAPARAGPAAGRRLLVKDLIDTAGIRTTYGSKIYADHVPTRTAPRGRAARRARRRRRRQGEPARVRLGRDEPEPVVRHRPEPAPARAARPAAPRAGNAAALAAGLCDLGARHRHGLLDPAPGGVLRHRRAEAELGPDPDRRRVPALPDASTPSARWRDGRRTSRSMWSVLAGEPVPEPRLAGLDGRPAHAAAVGRRAGAAASNRAAEAYVERLEQLGARVVEAEIPEPPATPGRSSTTRRPSRTARRSRRAPTSTARTCARSSSPRRRSSPRGRSAPATRSRRGAATGRRSTSTSRPCSARAAAGGLRRARGAPPAVGVPAPVQRARLGGARDRRPPARRAARRGRARARGSPGSRRRYGVMSWIVRAGGSLERRPAAPNPE